MVVLTCSDDCRSPCRWSEYVGRRPHSLTFLGSLFPLVGTRACEAVHYACLKYLVSVDVCAWHPTPVDVPGMTQIAVKQLAHNVEEIPGESLNQRV